MFKIRVFIMALFFQCIQVSLPAQNKRLISGSVSDAITKEPLPYVTVSLKKQMIGIITNEEGNFDLYIPEELVADTLVVNYLGYKHYLIDLAQINGLLAIKLEQTTVQLEEIVIRALSPEIYIQMAMRKVKDNYSNTAFETEAYYREKLLENKNLVKCDEGIFKTCFVNYVDTLPPINQLLLLRRANPQSITFMNYKKKDTLNFEKDKKSALSSLGGPAEILKNYTVNKEFGAYLDTSQFKSYKYSFAKSSSYNTSELIVIDFQTKHKVHRIRESGQIYIDKTTLTIVKIENKGDYKLPAVIKPLFFFLSIGIKNPVFDQKVEFQQVDGRWYPKNIQATLNLIVTNNHLFKKDEYSDFQIEQFYTVNKLKTENPTDIPLEKRFDVTKDISKQVYNDGGLTWEGLNIIKEIK